MRQTTLPSLSLDPDTRLLCLGGAGGSESLLGSLGGELGVAAELGVEE